MVLLDVMELPKIQMRMIICWYLNMLKMVIYNHLSKNFKEITWENKIRSLYQISEG